MNWKLWGQGLLAAAIGGAAGGATEALSAKGQIDEGTLSAAGIGALLMVLAYLKQPANTPKF